MYQIKTFKSAKNETGTIGYAISKQRDFMIILETFKDNLKKFEEKYLINCEKTKFISLNQELINEIRLFGVFVENCYKVLDESRR